MTCKQCRDYLDALLDDSLDEQTALLVHSHRKECPECRRVYEDRLLLVELLREEEMLELPAGFEEGLHEKLMEASVHPVKEKEGFKKERKTKRPFYKKRWVQATGALAASFLVITLALGSMGGLMSGGSYESAVMEDMAMAEPGMSFDKGVDNFAATARSVEAPQSMPAEAEMASEESFADEGPDQYRQDRLIIRHLNFSLDVLEFDEVYRTLESLVADRGGFVAGGSVYYKHYDPRAEDESLKAGYLELRVPSQHLSEFVERIRGLGVVKNEESYSQDVTAQYRDTVNRLQNLEASEKRLRELMEEADLVADVIEIERELARLRTEIDGMKGQVKHWEQLADLATVQVSLNEVLNYDDQIKPLDRSLGDRIRDAFVSSINRMIAGSENFVIGLVYNLPSLLILALVGTVVIVIVKKRRKRNEQQKK